MENLTPKEKMRLKMDPGHREKDENCLRVVELEMRCCSELAEDVVQDRQRGRKAKANERSVVYESPHTIEPGSEVERALSQTPPRVQAANFRSLFNGWVTSRRFQQRFDGGCVFQCGGDDAVKHYLHCPFLHSWASRRHRLAIPAVDRWHYAFGLHEQADVRVGLLHYVAHCSFNAPRLQPALHDVLHVFEQALHEVLRGHQVLSTLMADLWR